MKQPFCGMPQDYRELVVQYGALIRHRIRECGVWNETFEDLYQDILKRLIEQDILARYQESNVEAAIYGEDRPFIPYLMRAVSNHIINYMRHSNRDALCSVAFGTDPDSLQHSTDPTIGVAFVQALDKAEHLGTTCRDVFKLLLKGLTTAEIADTLNVSQSAVKVTRSKLRRALS